MRHALFALLALTALAAGPPAGAPDPDIFAGETPVDLTLSAPFTELFSHSASDSDYHVRGRLTWSDAGSPPVTLDGVVVSERGHTSRQTSECAFPKLKIDLSQVSRKDTPLEHVKTLKVGTHCGDRDDDELTPKYGRLASERSPLREAMVYAMLHAAGVPTLLARPARVSYEFADAGDRAPLRKAAFLLEDDNEARARLGASGQIDETAFGSAREQFNPRDTARLAFAEAMLGNFDWCVRMFRGDIYRCDDRHPLWNVLAFERQGERAVPLPYDFDLSGPVVGRHVWFDEVFSEKYAEPPSNVTVEVEAQVQRTRSLFDRRLLDETRAYFVSARPAILNAIEKSNADGRGKDLARQYVGAFFDAIESDGRFYSRVVIEGGHEVSLAPDGSKPACGDRSMMPVGTPVSAPLEVSGDYSQVRVLDALWEWAGSNRCDAVHKQPVWIRSDAIGTAYPR